MKPQSHMARLTYPILSAILVLIVQLSKINSPETTGDNILKHDRVNDLKAFLTGSTGGRNGVSIGNSFNFLFKWSNDMITLFHYFRLPRTWLFTLLETFRFSHMHNILTNTIRSSNAQWTNPSIVRLIKRTFCVFSPTINEHSNYAFKCL